MVDTLLSRQLIMQRLDDRVRRHADIHDTERRRGNGSIVSSGPDVFRSEACRVLKNRSGFELCIITLPFRESGSRALRPSEDYTSMDRRLIHCDGRENLLARSFTRQHQRVKLLLRDA